MHAVKPSRTALAAAVYRAEHQVLEQGRIFSDPLALRILGPDAERVARDDGTDTVRRRMRLFIALRTRFAETALANALEGGLRQLVVLGAGLDTYAYRAPLPSGLRAFEVDHPATQAWKRQRLAEAAIAVPSALTFAPVDFERETLDQGLAAVGFDRARQTFFTWLGVVPYLTASAIWSTLGFISGLPGGAHVVFDYSDPPGSLTPEARAVYGQRAARLAALGEKLVSFFEPAELHGRLKALGFSEIEDLDPPRIVERCFPGHALSVPPRGGHILRAVRRSTGSAPEPAARP